MSKFGALEAQIVTDVAADVSGTTILVNNTLAKAVRLLQVVSQRPIDDLALYTEIKRITNTPNTARAAGTPHDWIYPVKDIK